MKILLVSDWYPPDLGGVHRHTENLAKSLQQHGEQVMVVAPSLNLKSSHKTENQVEVQRFPAFLSPILPEYFRVTLRPGHNLEELIRQWHPDVIHVQVGQPLGFAALKLARKYKIPSIFTYHIFIYTSKGKWWRPIDLLYWRYWRYIFSLATIVTVPAQSTIDFLHQAYGPMDLVCLPNGIDLSEYGQRVQPVAQAKQKLGLEGNIVFLYVGRLSAEKRLVDAINGIHLTSNQNIRFIIIGDGPQESELKSLTNQLHETARIKFVGRLDRESVKRYYEAADANLFPSPIESHSIAMLEALSYGLPVLGANGGGIGAVIGDHRDGLLYPAQNPQAVSASIQDFIAMTEPQRQQLSQNARLTAKKFDYSTVATEYIDVYQQAINKSANQSVAAK